MKAWFEFKVLGIKCDNPACDYRNHEVKFQDYPLWLYKPCPKCGHVLLTQKDVDDVKHIIKMVEAANLLLKEEEL